MEPIEIIINGFVTIFSFGLLVVSVGSYLKFKQLKLLFVSIVFLIFFIQGMFLSIGMFDRGIASLTTGVFAGLFDLIILVILFLAIFKR